MHSSWILFVLLAPAKADVRFLDVEGVGRLRCNVLGDGITEALGIPYAAPANGTNRFRPPQPLPVRSVKHEVDATSLGPACWQRLNGARHHLSGTISSGLSMHEDCLKLNVWAPGTRGGLFPVFFWIHGGGFETGSGGSYNSTLLARQGIVAVSINYRLGPFAWFVSEEIRNENPDAPSNGGVHGILDQVAAMKWVHAHISAFGGDQSQVTIAGESAGSMSVCIHLHFPASQSLFERAILESGSCTTSPWSWTDINATIANEKSTLVLRGAHATNLAELRSVSPEALQEAGNLAGGFGNPSPDGFYMKDAPEKSPVLKRGTQIIIGSNTMDTLFAPPYLEGIEAVFNISIPNTTADYERLVHGFFGDTGLSLYPAPPKAATAIAVQQAFYRISADVCNTCPKHWLAEKLRDAGDIVYVYHFGFNSDPSSLGLACHACEMADAFDRLVTPPMAIFNSTFDSSLGTLMSEAWVSFAKHGIPQLGDLQWPSYKGSVSSASFLNISTGFDRKPTVDVDHGLAFESCTFFKKFIAAGENQRVAYSDFCNMPELASGDTSYLIV